MKAVVGKRYRHYKGGEYTVLAIARLEPNPGEHYVVYQAHQGDLGTWIRERSIFEERVQIGDTAVERFTELP